MTQSDLFAPALALAGLDPDRVIYVEARDETSLLSCFEEGLRHGGLGGVIAEAARLSMTASRRLQLAAESTGTRSEEHTSELQSLMRISYAVFCLKKKHT